MNKGMFHFTSRLLCVLSLAGCYSRNGGYESKPIHTHSYVDQTFAPTCTQQGYTLYKCECGHTYKDSYKDCLGHNWLEGNRNYLCSRCSQSEAEGFTFELSTMNGESCYIIRSCNSNVVVNGILNVPRKYESLPVRGIANWSFSSITKQVKKVLIHDNIKNIYSNLWHGTSIWTPDWETMSELEEIVFDASCKGMRIESGAFNNCPKLSKANITKGMIKSVPSDAVRGLNGGTADYIFKDTPYFKNNAIERDGLYYIADLLLYADLNEVNATVNIDSDTVWINACLFCNCTILKSVTIPNTVGVIGQSAFSNCINLETINFNGTVSQFRKIIIGPSAFTNLKSKFINCLDGNVNSYTYNGYTYTIGE